MQNFLLFICACCLLVCAAAAGVYLQQHFAVEEAKRRAVEEEVKELVRRHSPSNACEAKWGPQADLRQEGARVFCCKEKATPTYLCNAVQ